LRAKQGAVVTERTKPPIHPEPASQCFDVKNGVPAPTWLCNEPDYLDRAQLLDLDLSEEIVDLVLQGQPQIHCEELVDRIQMLEWHDRSRFREPGS
jgi:hypothetical protein